MSMPELAELAQQLHHQLEIVVLQLLDVRQDLVADELLRRVPDRDLLFREIFRDKHVFRWNVGDQEFTALQQFRDLFRSHLPTSHSGFPCVQGFIATSYLHLTLM